MGQDTRLTEKQKAVVSVLQEGRATPKHIVDNSDAIPSKHSAHDRLKDLRAIGVVRKINKGLYELTDDPPSFDEDIEGSELDFPGEGGDGS